MAFDDTRRKELQAALDTKMASNKEIADSFKIEDGNVIVDADQKTAFDQNMSDIREIKGLIEAEVEMANIDEWGTTVDTKSVAAEFDASDPIVQEVAAGLQTVGEAFLQSEQFKALAGGHNGVNMPAPFEYKTSMLDGMTYKDVYSSMPTGTPGAFGRVERDPIVIPPKRKTRVRDLFPSRKTSAAIVEYFRMTGFTNNAAMVAEYASSSFGAKPQSSMTFVGEQAPVRTLAHWEAAHRNVLADEPQLRSIIDNELLYGLRLEEDDQILNGNGTGENLEGILTNTGIQTYSWSSGASTPVSDTKADAVRRAATLSFLAYYEPSGVVLHPNDWEDIELNKDSNGQYLMAVSIQQGGEARLWRMPVVDTPAIAEGTALVGSFGQGAQIYDRETANIRISEQHEDFFVRNAIVVLAEQRLALAVKRPESFVEVVFDAAP
jgi:HK97 family phage major capsid protein